MLIQRLARRALVVVAERNDDISLGNQAFQAAMAAAEAVLDWHGYEEAARLPRELLEEALDAACSAAFESATFK